MTNHFIEVLEKILNFGIKKDEVLNNEERIKKVELFKDNFKIEDYLKFFEDLENYILNEEIDSLEKDAVISLLLDVLSSLWILEDNISLLPSTIVILYNSYISFLRINLIFEGINKYNITSSIEFESIIYDYIEFLKNPTNELFIHYVYSKIRHFNERLKIYLDSENFEGIKHKNCIENIDLLLCLGQNFRMLELSRS